jgi:Ca2+/Na+ antiporter
MARDYRWLENLLSKMGTIIFKEFFTSLAVALVLFVIFALFTRSRIRRTGSVWSFLFVLMATWAGGVWIRPFGPVLAHVRWLQFLVVGLLAVLLAALFAPLKPPRNRHETLEQLEEMPRQRQLEKMSFIALGIVFWIVLCVLIWAVIANYLR